MNTSKCLDVYNHEGPYVQTSACDGSDSQKWEYDEQNLTFTLKGKCLSSLVDIQTIEVWAGNLSNGSYAVLLVNRASYNASIEISWKDLGFKEEKAKLRDLWEKKDLGEFKDGYNITLESHDSQMLKVTPIKDDKDDDDKGDDKDGDDKGDDQDEDEDNKGDGKLFTILGIVFGCLILLIIIIIVIICCIKKKSQKPNTNEVDNNKLIDSKRTTTYEGEEAN